MSFKTLGPVAGFCNTPMKTERGDSLTIQESSSFGKWLNFVQSIIGRVAPLTVNNAFFIDLSQIPIHANNAAAVAAGLSAGNLYRTNADPDFIAVVH